MQFDLISDIHLNIAKEFKIPLTKYFPDKTGSDYLFLAGDLCEDWVGNENVRAFLTKTSKLYKKIVVVLGNHDYWHLNGDFDESRSFEKIPQYCADFVKMFDNKNKIVVLNNSFIQLDDVWVYGTTLWSDIPPQYYAYVQSRIGDYRYIYKENGNPVTYFDTVKANYVAFNGISDFVSSHRKDKVVILTHHTPSFQCGCKGYDEVLDYAYHNKCDNFIVENPQIKAWCFGHCHKPRDFLIGKTQIVSNPLGYVGDGYFCERVYKDKKLVDWHLKTIEI